MDIRTFLLKVAGYGAAIGTVALLIVGGGALMWFVVYPVCGWLDEPSRGHDPHS
jgi:hypothetical protein